MCTVIGPEEALGEADFALKEITNLLTREEWVWSLGMRTAYGEEGVSLGLELSGRQREELPEKE